MELGRSDEILNILKVESAGHAVEMDVGYKKMRELKMAKVFFLSTGNVGVTFICEDRTMDGAGLGMNARRYLLSLRCPLDIQVVSVSSLGGPFKKWKANREQFS